jgi:hypothetical protein
MAKYQVPEGPVGVAIKLLAGLIVAFWWAGGPGAEEARCVSHSATVPGPLAGRGGHTADCARARAAARRPPQCIAFHLLLLSAFALMLQSPSHASSPHRTLSTTQPHTHHTTRSEARNKQEKRTPYSRHYALKGRGRKEQLMFENKGDRTELVPTRAAVGM